VGTVAFQTAVSWADLAQIWSEAHRFEPGMLARWAIVLSMHVVTPFACLLLGFYVAKARIWDAKAWLMLALLISFSVASDGSNKTDEAMQWPVPLNHAALIYRTLAIYSWPVFMLFFAIQFPERAAFDRRRPGWKWLAAVPAAIVFAGSALVRIARNEGANLENLQVLDRVALRSTLLYGLLALSLLILFLKLVRSPAADDKRRLRVLFSGLGVSFVPALLLDLIMAARGHRSYSSRDISPWLSVSVFSLFLLFPFTLAYVTFVQRALDVGVILRQGLQYAMARRGLVLLQFVSSLIVILLVAIFAARVHFAQRLLLISAGIGTIFLTSVLIHLVGRWLDRRFFREAYNAEQILARLSETAGSLSDLPALLATVVSRVREALHIDDAVVFLASGNEYQVAFADGKSTIDTLFAADSATVKALSASNRALSVYTEDRRSWASDLPEKEKKKLEELRAQLLIPLARREELLGFLALGPRAAEAPYAPRDIDLLQSVAQQTALAIENTRLTAKVASEIAEREVIERELAIAREVQQRLLPRAFPQVAGLKGFGTCRPAREVGGDYFDFLLLPDGGLGVAIGDVSGKGVPASLLMASLQASLRGQTLAGCGDLTNLIGNVNRLLHSTSPENRYATFFYAQYDPSARSFTYVNAGHNPPIVAAARCGIKRLDAGGPPVGLLPIAPYQSASLELQSGDRIVLYTDGISEAMNANNEEWGEENLVAAVENAGMHEPEAMARQIFNDADAFAAGAAQHDDMTVVVLCAV
jgi:sigma-B regulation protein RsbU (phosphoserine phosphatase)